MSRADLLALTPESVAALANLGLVKRAQKEIEAGKGPAIEEDDAGVVLGRFEGGVVTKLPPGVSLRDASCSCGAVTVCRHRVALALAYASWCTTPAPALEAWSPACFDDAALAKLTGKRIFQRAQAIVRSGLVVELEASATMGAKLPTCTVRFHVPRDLGYARCDCKAAVACEHVVVACWAFRHAEATGAALPCTIELGALADGGSDAPFVELRRLVDHVLTEGVSNLGDADRPRFARVRSALGAGSGYVWPASIVDEMEIAIEAYRARSARYRTADVTHLVASLGARDRAVASGAGELPRRFVLGEGEARETALDHVRLVSLGARIEPDGTSRDVEVFLADPDSGVVLVASRRFTYEDDATPEDGPELARRAITGRITLGALAHGQLVTRAAKRHANHAVTLAATRTAQTSVAPSTGDWGALPPSLLVRDFTALAKDLRSSPPRLLTPFTLASRVRVLAIPPGQVLAVGYRPGDQEVVADLGDGRGGCVRLVRRHTRAAPHALDVLASALDGSPGPRFVAGEVHLRASGVEIEPTAIVTDRVLVPDLDVVTSRAERLPSLGPKPSSFLLMAIEGARGVIEEALHDGLSHVRPGFAARAGDAGEACGKVGLGSLERRLLALSSTPEPKAWLDAAIRMELTEEAIAAGSMVESR